jgi:hypothetical protein
MLIRHHLGSGTMIEILRVSPDEVLWQATLVLHALAPTAQAMLSPDSLHIELSVTDFSGRITGEKLRASDLPAELVRHAAARLAKAATACRPLYAE